MVAKGNVGLAFGLTVIAGLCTTLGSFIPFFSKLLQPKFLASGLSFSAGVMVYVSFIEIFLKSVIAFEETSAKKHAYLLATVCFFGGIVISKILDLIVHKLDPHSHFSDDQKKYKYVFYSDSLPETPIEEVIPSGESVDSTSLPRKKEGDEESKEKNLKRTGLFTALAIGLHNFPEGLATFVSALADSRIGITLAIAIAIHNVLFFF